ncbi:hypothetical protein A9Q87_00105 [Flavobacteriales bacterium 34_180_T64]|nr:hypothetical protein A9Q87_00105 [Flavobacteriales bacterium 34_180_T64]
MTQKINILIPDGSSTWAMSVISCLSRIKSYKLFVLSSKKQTPAKYSRYTSYFKYYEKKSDASWLHIINAEIEENEISVVVPIAENEIHFFIKYAHQISDSTKIIPLPDLGAFAIAINKRKLNKILKDSDIPHPNSVFIEDINEIKKVDSIKFPVLLKPLHEKGGDGILRFDSSSDLKPYLSENKALFLQEYIKGYDIDCSVLYDNGALICHTIQKGNLSGHNTYAPHLGFDFYNDDQVLSVVKQVMSKLNWSGVAHVDLRYDALSKTFKILEINARFWGSVETSKIVGINFPDLAIKLALGKPIEPQNFESISALRFKGFLKLVKRRPSTLFRFKFIRNNTEVPYVLKDPMPIIFRWFEWFGRKMSPD